MQPSRLALVVAVLLAGLSACREPASVIAPPPAPTPPTRCATIADELARLGPDARSVHFVFYVDAPSCKKHPDARVLRLEVDGKLVREVRVPCEGPDDAGVITIVAPAPGIHVEPFLVEEGMHHFTVIDPERHDEDLEAASIPHLEVTGTAVMVGNEFEVVEMDDGLRVRGPVAIRMPRL